MCGRHEADVLQSGSGDVNIESTNIKTASGVSLDDHQRTLVGSVLDVGVPFTVITLYMLTPQTAFCWTTFAEKAFIVG